MSCRVGRYKSTAPTLQCALPHTIRFRVNVLIFYCSVFLSLQTFLYVSEGFYRVYGIFRSKEVILSKILYNAIVLNMPFGQWMGVMDMVIKIIKKQYYPLPNANFSEYYFMPNDLAHCTLNFESTKAVYANIACLASDMAP